MATKRRLPDTLLSESTEVERTVSQVLIGLASGLIGASAAIVFQAIPILTSAGILWAGGLSVAVIVLSGLSIIYGCLGMIVGPGSLGLRDRFNLQAITGGLGLVAAVGVGLVAMNFRVEIPDLSKELAALETRIGLLEGRVANGGGASAVSSTANATVQRELETLKAQVSDLQTRVVTLQSDTSTRGNDAPHAP